MTKTTNYNLNKPEAGDPMRVADFNENADIIDAALGLLSAERVVVGSYVGDGVKNRMIELSFTPKAVIILGHINGKPSISIATAESDRYATSDGCSYSNSIRVVEGGFMVGMAFSGWDNTPDTTEYYIAIG